jgi:hypothetical protein
MQRIILWLIAMTGLGLLGLITYKALRPTGLPAIVQPAPRINPPPPAPNAEPVVRYPVPELPADKPLPALDTSDATMKSALAEVFTDISVIEIIALRNFVRHVVATIDNLQRRKVALRLLPLKPATGQFSVSGDTNDYTIATDNAARYSPYVRLVDAVDSAKVVAFYFHYYPLFQQAYRDLGYPGGHFNDRLVDTIDHLIATPALQAPPRLVRPKVFYLYADADLESRSAGQKILMRMGNDNTARVKAKLRQIRSDIASQPSPPKIEK